MLRRWKTRNEKTDDFLKMREQDLRIVAAQNEKIDDPTKKAQSVPENQRFIPWNERNDIDLTDTD